MAQSYKGPDTWNDITCLDEQPSDWGTASPHSCMFPLNMPDCIHRVLTSEKITLKPQGERERGGDRMIMKDANEHQVFIQIAQPANTTTAQSPSAWDWIILFVSHPTWERTESGCSPNYTLLPYYTSSSQFNVWLQKALILWNVSSTQSELQQKDSCYL